jgi:hypothetical protein
VRSALSLIADCSVPVLLYQARDPVEVVVVDLESFQAVDRVEEIIPAGAEYPTSRRNGTVRLTG